MDVFRRLSAGAVPSGRQPSVPCTREAAWYGRHTHLMIEMQGGTVADVAGLETAPPASPVRQWFEISRLIFTGRCADKFEILDCHQRSQIQANASKRTQQTEASIQLILLGIVRERFAALGATLITNLLLYH